MNVGHRRRTTTAPGGFGKRGWRNIPNSNLLKVKLGWYHLQAGLNFWSDDVPADFRKAGELVRTVLAKENLSPQVKRLAHWLFAWVLTTERDFSRALNEADTAIALAPYDGCHVWQPRAGGDHVRQTGQGTGVERFRARP